MERSFIKLLTIRAGTRVKYNVPGPEKYVALATRGSMGATVRIDIAS